MSDGHGAVGDARKRAEELNDKALADWEAELLATMSPIELPLRRLVDETYNLMVDRHRKYGPGNIAEFGDTGLLVRMGDKFARLRNGYKDFGDESLEDTLKDIIGYSLIWLMWNRGQWPGQEVN